MTDPNQECVLIVGNRQTNEMRTIVEAVCDICGGTQVTYTDQVNKIPAGQIIPKLIIICQNWPDEFSTRDFKELFRRFPISRTICCYGVWCESDGRTRTTLPVSIRIPARSARVRIQYEWNIVHEKEEAYPLTAGRDEIFQIESSKAPFRVDSNGMIPLICIISGDCFYQTMLQEMILSWNGQLLNMAQKDDADLIIYDLDPWELVSDVLPTYQFTSPVVGLMGLPHPETIIKAQRLGCETIVSKVTPEKELFQTIKHCLNLKAISLEGD